MMPLKFVKWFLIGGTLALASSCLCESELCRVGGGGVAIGGGASAPSQPMAPPVNYSQSEEDYSSYEQHGAVSPDDCLKMLKRFQLEGRSVRFVKAVKNPYNKGGGVLEYMCLFDGDDAGPEATPFEDDRLPQSEYVYP